MGVYPNSYWQGAHKSESHDYTGLTGEDDYVNGANYLNSVLGCVSWGTGVTGHVQAIEYTLGLTPAGTHGTVRGRLEYLEDRAAHSVCNFYIAGHIDNGLQAISGISFSYQTVVSAMEVNLRTAPIGAIGGHFEIWDGDSGTGARYLEMHMNAGEIWGSVTGASLLDANQHYYIYSKTGSTMGDANVTLHFEQNN